jgi:hypothetical protein
MSEISLHFHQVRQGETPEHIAKRYRVPEASIRHENPDLKFETGDIVVINLKDQHLKAA